MINYEDKKSLYEFYSDWAWSHLITVVMFGMLEVAVKNSPSCVVWKNQQKGYIDKYKSIELFLVNFLPENTRNDVSKRYKTENNINLNSFTDVTRHYMGRNEIWFCSRSWCPL